MVNHDNNDTGDLPLHLSEAMTGNFGSNIDLSPPALPPLLTTMTRRMTAPSGYYANGMNYQQTQTSSSSTLNGQSLQ